LLNLPFKLAAMGVCVTTIFIIEYTQNVVLHKVKRVCFSVLYQQVKAIDASVFVFSWLLCFLQYDGGSE
jgi:hypothetical protein